MMEPHGGSLWGKRCVQLATRQDLSAGTAMSRPFLCFPRKRGKRGGGLRGQSPGHTCRETGRFPIRAGEEGTSRPDSSEQQLHSFRLKLRNFAGQRRDSSHSPTALHLETTIIKSYILPIHPVPNRPPTHQAPPPVFFLKPHSVVPQNTVELQGFSQTPLGICPSHAQERTQHLFFSHFKSNHHFLHAGASTCNSLSHLKLQLQQHLKKKKSPLTSRAKRVTPSPAAPEHSGCFPAALTSVF